ncbi:MAG: MerR family transcriptional regulator [Candidatus Nealsonbacteria bacterium]|nr:MerR family transcriptional regulator [Candidatus Nealsonbacteria bacterium]
MTSSLLLSDVARILGVKGYQINYVLVNGLVPEPRQRIANKRIFTRKDVERLADHFGINLEEKGYG